MEGGFYGAGGNRCVGGGGGFGGGTGGAAFGVAGGAGAWAAGGGGGERRSGLRVVQEHLRRAKKMEMGARERERMVHLATLLPGAERLIMQAYLEHGMTVKELAELHRTTAREMRRRVDRLRE